MAEPAPPLISVVVAAYNAAETLGGCIDSILGQTYPSLEILIVDDGSTDATPKILENHPARQRFVAIRTKNGGPSRARNLGVARASGEWVAFFDSDCLLHPRCLEILAGGFLSDDTASVGGAQHSPDDETPFGRAVQRYFESIGFMTGYIQEAEGEAVYTEHNPTCNVLYRRAVFESLQGFDEGLWPGEDVDLDHRATLAGHRHRFEPRAIVYHYRPASLQAFHRMMTSYGRSQRLLARRYGFIRTLAYLPPAIAIGLLLVAAGLWWWPLQTAWALAGIAAMSIVFLERLRRRSRLGVVFYTLFTVNVTGWLSGFVQELVKPRFNRRPSLPEF